MCEYACVRKRKKFLNEYISVLPELSGEVPLWNLVTSSLDRNLINLRCACGTCAETKKNVLDCTREPPCWNLDSLCTRCVLLSVAVPFCSVTVRSL